MASKREIKRFAFKLDRKLIKYEKVMQSQLLKELKRQENEIIANDGKFENKMLPILLKAYETIGLEIAEEQFKALGTTFKKDRFFLEAWQKWIDDVLTFRLIRKIDDISEYTALRYKEIMEVIQDVGLSIPRSEIERRLHKELGKGVFSKSRARMIARTETASLANESKNRSAETWKEETGLKQYKMWIHRGASDPREPHVALDGIIVEDKEDFQIVNDDGSVEYAKYPHDPNLSAQNVINCSCQVMYVGEDYANSLR